MVGAVYSNGNTTWNGAPPQNIDGDFHTNGWLEINGDVSGWITGMATAVDIAGSTSPPTIQGDVQDLPWPVQFKIEDFRPGGPIQELYGDQYVEHSIGARPSDIKKPGVHYFPGALEDKGPAPNITGPITVVSESSVEFGYTFTAFHEGLAILANGGSGSCNTHGINLSGGNWVIEGILFAPHGRITLQGGSGQKVVGSVIGWDIRHGLNGPVEVDPSLFPSGTPDMFLLD